MALRDTSRNRAAAAAAAAAVMAAVAASVTLAVGVESDDARAARTYQPSLPYGSVMVFAPGEEALDRAGAAVRRSLAVEGLVRIGSPSCRVPGDERWCQVTPLLPGEPHRRTAEPP